MQWAALKKELAQERQRYRLPDFLGIGAQKSATTWLWHILRHHPEIFLPEQKEIHYFSKQPRFGLQWYSDHFSEAGDKRAGEITPAYAALSPAAIQYIQAIQPHLRLLIILRNPIERAWSHAVMHFSQAQERDLETVTSQEWQSHFIQLDSILRGDYVTVLENWLKAFPEEQLFIGLYEDIQHNPKELLSQIFTHLGVSIPDGDEWNVYPLLEKAFVGEYIEIPKEHAVFLRELYAQRIELLQQRVQDSRIKEWLAVEWTPYTRQ